MTSGQLGPISEAIKTGYGIELVELVELTGGNDPFARTFQATTEAGDRFFVKLRVGIDPGISLCAALHGLGIQAVLAPIKTISGDFACSWEGKAILMYPYKEGHNGFERPLELAHWRQIGLALREIHDSQLPEDISSQLGRERFEVDGVASFEATKARLLSSSADYPADKALTAIMMGNLGAIDHVLDRTPVLGMACQSRQWMTVPCHADLHVGNVLVEANGFVNIIDWDAPRLAPRECDLVFFCKGGILGEHGDAEEASFFSGYGVFEPDDLAITYYRYARVLEDFVAYARDATDESSSLEERMDAVRGFDVLFRPRKDGRASTSF
jgi:spectinomycin phosphotransferase